MEKPKVETHKEPDEVATKGETESASAESAATSNTTSNVKDTASSVLSSPSKYGNIAGDKIQSALGTVGGPIGTGLETATKPVGNVVDGVVGSVFRAGDMAMSESGLGKEADATKGQEEGQTKKE